MNLKNLSNKPMYNTLNLSFLIIFVDKFIRKIENIHQDLILFQDIVPIKDVYKMLLLCPA